MKLITTIIFVFLVHTGTVAQYEQMLHKPYKEKVEDIAQLYQNMISIYVKDSVEVNDYSLKMKKWALANGDKELALEADLLKAYSIWHVYGSTHPEVVQELKNVAEKGKQQNIPNIEERAVKTIASHYWNKKNYEKAFEWLLRTAKILEKMDSDSFPNMASHLNFIGLCYYYFGDYENAVTYFKKASELQKTSFNSVAVIEAQNSLGLCYQKLGNFKLSNKWFSQIIDDTTTYANPIWQGIASGNLGYNYYLNSDYEKAIPLFETDIAGALKINDFGLAAGSTIPLSDIYLKQNQLKKAKEKIDESQKYIRQSGQTDRLRKLYPIMSKWYAANNESEKSMAYLDSAMASAKEHDEEFNSLQLLRANQTVEAKEKQMEIEKLNTESQLKLSQRNFIIFLIAILLIASIITFWFRNKIHLKKQKIKELELDNTQKALSNAKSRLENLMLKVRQDHNLIVELTEKKATDTNKNLLSQLKTKNILTQDDWEQYQSLFKEVYPDFLPSLLASYPELSQAEIRYLCLEKLQLTNNEMALVLGVSSNTVRVTKHRIRKKFNLEGPESMDSLIEELETKSTLNND